jgi:glycosyltransferase involved in cell wall biosynthesis
MKILQVCPRYYPYIGGVEEHVRNISERLAKKYEVSVFTTDPSGKLPKEEVINGVYVRRFKSWAPNEAYYFSRQLKKYLMKNSESYDVVHAHNYHAFPALYAAQAKGRNRLVFTPHYHGTGHTFFRSLLHIPYRYLGKKIFEKAEKIVCVSKYEKKLISNHFGVNEEKVMVIPNGVNLEEFKVLEKRKKGYRTILYVGRLEKYKGIQYLIRVLPRLCNDMVLEIVGKGSYKKSLVKLAGKLGVEDRVKFFQDLPRAELLQKYADADLFVLLSVHEAYGISIAEALASGTPCIVAKTSALKEWIDDTNCFGIDFPINLSQLKNLINNVIGKDLQKLKIPDWNETTEKLLNLYERC